jgi:hypothetical protein
MVVVYFLSNSMGVVMKNIYIIVCGANQARNIKDITDPLIKADFNVFVFPTAACEEIVDVSIN